MKKVLFVLLASLLTVTSYAQDNGTTDLGTAVENIGTVFPDFKEKYVADKECAATALHFSLDTAETAFFNPMIPHCNALHLASGMSAWVGNIPGMIGFANLAVMTGCLNPLYVPQAYTLVYNECVAAKQNRQ